MLLVAVLRDRITIIIVPIVVLRQDMYERSNEKGILCAE
jgi:superfamily II DNA helicase RecQ